MQIENNINFNGQIANPVNSKNELVRYSINQLKHYVGGHNVEHQIDFNQNENHLEIMTRLFPKKSSTPICPAYCYTMIKRLDLISKDEISQQIKGLTNWVKRINKQINNKNETI